MNSKPPKGSQGAILQARKRVCTKSLLESERKVKSSDNVPLYDVPPELSDNLENVQVRYMAWTSFKKSLRKFGKPSENCGVRQMELPLVHPL
jgi:hypothetical protein